MPGSITKCKCGETEHLSVKSYNRRKDGSIRSTVYRCRICRRGTYKPLTKPEKERADWLDLWCIDAEINNRRIAEKYRVVQLIK